MSEGRADFFGQPVNVGDQVAFMQNVGGQRVRRELTQGRVVKMLPSGIVVRHACRWDKALMVETLCKLEFIRVPDAYRNPSLEIAP